MILHFSHIGLTEGRTFTLKSRSLAGDLSVGSSPGLWRPARLVVTLKPQRGMLATSAGDAVSRAYAAFDAAARPLEGSCHGVRILGPAAVIAIVNSK